MLYNYFKIAVRNLLRHKLFSFINIFGLATGMSVCLLALMQVRQVLDYDQFHPHPERTYRVLTNVHKTDGHRWRLASAPLPLGEVLAGEYGFVEKTARVYYHQSLKSEWDYGRKTLPARGAFVDTGFYDVFGYRLARGRPAVAPRTALITHETAARFFGRENPVGKTLSNKGLGAFTVSGVLAPLPGKTHLEFDLLVSMATVPLLNASTQMTTQMNDWKTIDLNYTYVLLRQGTPREALDRVLPGLADRAHREEGPNMDRSYAFRTQPFSRISPAWEDLHDSTWEPTLGMILGIGGMALVILVLAGFNYVNLTLARSLSRAREVGIRKVAGAHRSQLVRQFLTESVLLAFLALWLAYFMLSLLEQLPAVQRWYAGGIPKDALLWLFFVGFALLTGLLAGLAPARILSSYHPVQVLKGEIGPRLPGRMSLRKGLIVVQFAVSLLFVVFVTVYYQQFSYMATASYGFDRQGSINMPLEDVNPRVLAAEVARLPGVERVGFASVPPGFHADQTNISADEGLNFMEANFFSVDDNFVKNIRLPLLAGSNLPATVNDSAGRFVLVNEKTVEALKLGTPREAVGKLIWMKDTSEVQIVGVLKNFNYQNLSRPIRPLVLQYNPAYFRYLNVRVAQGGKSTIIPDLERTWKRLSPYRPFEGKWYDEQLYNYHLHLDDQMLLAVPAVMAVIIAFLGLLGMVTYTTALRTKEVGIRKVMGAGAGQIVFLLSRGFVVLLLVAGGIALPLGYAAGTMFLQFFAYHVSIGLAPLGVCFGAMLLVGGLSVGIQTYRAATANPVKSLRSE
jgi:putative ABC transport system permease protein